MTTIATTDAPPPTPAPPPDAATGGDACWACGVRWIIGLAVALAAARLAYLAFVSPYCLIEDEAHYWEWSRRLDWSYYTKGPGIALAIRAATELLGTSELAVRLPAVLASSLATLLVGLLAADVAARKGAPNWRVGFFGAACFQLAPMNQLVGFVSTIDGPLIACWGAACWAGWRALERRSRWAWIALGAAVGAGFLFKYTMLLLPPGLLLYALLRRWGEGEAAVARRWQLWAIAGGVAALIGLAPVVVWNAQQGWPTVRHLLGHLGLASGDMPVDASPADQWTPLWLVEFLGMQFGLVGPALILACGAAAWGVWSWAEAAQQRRRAGVSSRALPGDEELGLLHGRLFLVCCAAPVLGFYSAVTLWTQGEGNWAMSAYVTLLPLAGWAAADAMREYAAKLSAWRRFPAAARPWSGIVRRKPETAGQVLWHAAIVYGLVAAAGMMRVDLVQGGLERVSPALARAVPVGRFIGAREMGLHAGDLAVELRDRTGREPLVVAQHYGRASLLAFYMPGRPVVFCASSRTGGRPTQYDLWPDTNLDDAALLGRPALMVGGDDAWARGFEGVTPLGPLRGDGKRGTRPAFTAERYTGLAPAEESSVAASGGGVGAGMAPEAGGRVAP